jgi:competence protein ComEC
MEMTANEVVQLDVGQGDAALVSWNEGGRSRIAAIDVGSARATDPSQWIRALARRGATQLDAVVLTHLDEDHSGVLAQLLPWIRIRCVILPPTLAPDDAWPVRRLLAERGIPVGHEASSCFPFPWQFTIHDSGPNGVMGGVLVPLRDGGAYLNLGDAGRQGHGASEMALAEAFRRDWPDLWGRARASQRLTLKLGHHGARTASSEELLKAFPPARAVVSSGWQNRYGHPHPETLERMRRVGVAVERTDLGGALIIQ